MRPVYRRGLRSRFADEVSLRWPECTNSRCSAAVFVLGYATLGLALLASLRFFGGGESTADTLGRRWRRRFPARLLASLLQGWMAKFRCRGCFGAASPSLYAIVLPWIALRLPGLFAHRRICRSTDSFNLPDIFDLPEASSFAERALFRGHGLAGLQSGFFYGEPFAYNFLFYCPPAAIAKLFGNPLAVFQTFPVFAVAVAAALPLTVLDIVSPGLRLIRGSNRRRAALDLDRRLLLRSSFIRCSGTRLRAARRGHRPRSALGGRNIPIGDLRSAAHFCGPLRADVDAAQIGDGAGPA